MAIGGGIPSDADNAGRAEPLSGGNFSFLDQALWKQFREAGSAEAFARAWLALQCRFVKGAGAGVVVRHHAHCAPGLDPLDYVRQAAGDSRASDRQRLRDAR